MKISGWLAAGFVLTFATLCNAQTFSPVAQVPAEIEALPVFVRPEVGQVFRIDWASLDAELAAAAGVPGGDRAAAGEQWRMVLPCPDGVTRMFRVVESSIMEPELAARFPQFKTYRVRGVDDPSAVGRIDVTTQGFRAMIRTDGGMVFIDPYSARQRDYISVYTLVNLGARENFWACGVGPEHQEAVPVRDPVENPDGNPGNLQLRTYRLAMACSGEYGAYQSSLAGNQPNVTDALAAIVTVANRCNATFEVDIGVRMLLVANNDQLAFFDPATDPYPNADPNCTSNPAADCSGPYLGANITALNNIIGSANFDIGHVLTRVRGGVAYLRAVCSGVKAGGVSGIPRGGEVDPVSALVPMHEMGHQFGANHTFNGVLGRCNANINGTTNWEPGGGSTLMAYAGACPVGGPIGEGDTDNVVQFADPYFHTGSVIVMNIFLASVYSSCFAKAEKNNAAAPVINSTSPSDKWIPRSTPFALTVDASDGSPALSFAWEQLDIGPAQRLTGPTSVDNGQSALFRTFPPVASPTRTFPRLSDLLAGTSYIGERMPTVANSTRKFRVTVRDNEGGSTTSSIVNVRIADAQPFVVTSPAAGQIVRNNALRVQWNSAAIAAAPISTQRVTISLSIDDGLTFPVTLANQALNHGNIVFYGLGISSNLARVKVSANGNIFFNVSGTFTLLAPCGPVDYNGDGVLNADDLSDYVTCYFDGAACSGADFNGDGLVNSDDLSDYITAYFDGC